jgi:hypothetical protein
MENAKNLLASEALNTSSTTLGAGYNSGIMTPEAQTSTSSQSPQMKYITKPLEGMLTLDEPLRVTIVD